LARVIARPDPMTLRPGVAISTAGGAKYLSSGAPDLKPTLARAFDLSLEWTPRPGAVVSLAVYHKAIRTTVQATITRPQAFANNPFGLPASVATIACGSSPGCSADLPIWQFARPANSGPGHLNGAEVAFQAPLGGDDGGADWILEGALAYTRTSVKMYNQALVLDSMEDALGAPRVAANLGLTYRRPGLELRATASHRGAYLATIPAPNGGDVDGVDAVTTLDASARVTLSDHFRLTLDAANLTNAIQRQFSDRTHIPNYQHRTGREVRVGLRADF
jgi:iron complex outermembrane receptor protein